MNANSFQFLRVLIVGYILLMFTLGGVSFAEPGIKIVEPQDGSKVLAGETISVVVEPVEGFLLEEVMIVTPFIVETMSSAPFSTELTIPTKEIGPISIYVVGKKSLEQFAEDEITIEIQSGATLESLNIYPPRLYLEEGEQMHITVKGKYSDGVERYITDGNKGTTYQSSNVNIVTVGVNGTAKIQGVGKATITASNAGLTVNIPVAVEK
ncbi:Ig-like domain-containing protein [Candidatus Pacearchaeota archaeon]|nr:Ig-like domain-containing protein [Candidatus Pacearchaeota archaeon]